MGYVGTLTYSRSRWLNMKDNYDFSCAWSYFVGVDKEQDEEDEFGQEDDQQNNEKLKKIIRKRRLSMSRNMKDT